MTVAAPPVPLCVCRCCKPCHALTSHGRTGRCQHCGRCPAYTPEKETR